MNEINGCRSIESVAHFTNSVLSLLGGMDNKKDLELLLSNLSPATIGQITDAAIAAEDYELCQTIKELTSAVKQETTIDPRPALT